MQETFQYCGVVNSSSIFIPDASTFAPTNVDTDQFAWPNEMHALTLACGLKPWPRWVLSVLFWSSLTAAVSTPSQATHRSQSSDSSTTTLSSTHRGWMDKVMSLVSLWTAVPSTVSVPASVGLCILQEELTAHADNGIMNNAFLNVVSGVVQPPSTLVPGQANITQDQYVQIVISQLTQLWSNCLSLLFATLH